MRIVQGGLDDATVLALLREHLEDAARQSPPGSVHALDPDALRKPGISFLSAWEDHELLGFGALQELDARHGEIKSMRTAAAHLGKGVASAILEQLVAIARTRGYRRLSIETGSGEAFAPAHSLYKKFGFRYCAPFADYTDDPFSRFMTLEL